jgi:signal transduction histidine kinase
MTASRSVRDVAQAAGLAAVYVAGAKLGLMLDAVSGFATVVWPPTGISLAALLLFGNRLGPGVAAGAFLANWWTGAPIPIACGIALGNTLEAILGAMALKQLARFRSPPDRLRDVLALIGLAAIISTTVSATMGVISLRLGGIVGAGRFGETWLAWWVGDALGNLVVAPLLLTWSGLTWAEMRRGVMRPRRLAEGAILAASLLAAGGFIFFGGHTTSPFMQVYMLFPLLIWAAVRFGLRGGTAATVLVSAIAIWGTTLRRGPFVQPTLVQSLFFLQVFMAIVAVTVLMLGAAITERAQAIRAREELLAVVSHDLRDPLSAVQMSAALLGKYRENDEQGSRARKQLEVIQRSTDRMSSLIRDLLDTAALDAGKLPMQTGDHDVGVLVGEVVDLFRPLALKRKQVLRAEGIDGGLRVMCDKDRFLQVLSNLISNAIKFTGEGGSISVQVSVLGRAACVTVADNGGGIAPDHLWHIFDRFWQANPGGRQGTGLGLFIAKGIVEAHGGKLWAESTVGAGSRFHCTIPLSGSEEAERDAAGFSWCQ